MFNSPFAARPVSQRAAALMHPFLSLTLSLLFLAIAGQSPARAELIFVTLQTSVVSFDISSGDSATIAASKSTVVSGLTEGMGLVFDNDGYLYAVQYTPGLVSKIDITTGTIVSSVSGFVDPRGITYDSATGNFYVANSGTSAPGNTISLISPGGTVSTYVSTGINSPYGLALDGSGALYAANNGNSSLTEVVAGVPSTLATFNPGSGTRGVAVSAAGDIYTSGDFGIQKTTSGGATSSFVASGSMGFPYGLAFDSSGNLFTASYTDNAIFAYDSLGAPLYSFSTGVLSADRPRFVAFNTEGSGFNQVSQAVPEPGTWAAAALLVGGAAFMRWRKRARVS
jgi:DNA-binding beta-propeller fold protein YncE